MYCISCFVSHVIRNITCFIWGLNIHMLSKRRHMTLNSENDFPAKEFIMTKLLFELDANITMLLIMIKG